MKKIILFIDGMTCSACSNGLEKYLNKKVGIINASVNLVMANATIEYDEKILNQKQLEELIKKAGFKSLGEFKEIKIEKENKKEKIKFVIFTILAILLMYISMHHMFNLPMIKFLSPYSNSTFYMICLLILTICFLFYGFDILKSGYKNLIHKTPNMDTLVGIGVVSSFIYSLYNMYLVLKGHTGQVTNLYFESSAIVIYFVKLGRYIDKISTDKTKEAIKKLVKITPETAIIKTNDNKEKKVTIDEICKGDIIISRPGEKIAVDGEILSGKAHVDESFITGESKPVAKNVNDQVIAGSLNYDGYIEYKALKIGKKSTISEIIKLVIESSNTKVPITKTIDKIASYFVPTVIIIAITTFIVYLLLGQKFQEALTTFITVLVVACPCSLGLATPLAVVVSQGLCINNGILVKKSEVFELLPKVNTIVFDKTGTLTYGQLKISEMINYSSIENNQLLQLVGSLEEKSTHPIKKAFTEYLEENKIEILTVSQFKEIAGMGIIGKINNEEILLGNSKLLTRLKIKNNHITDEEKLSKNKNSIVYVVKNNEIIGLIGVNDIIRENTKEVINELSKQKIATIMLTGDNTATAQKIAEEIKITKVIANVSPIEKAKIIKQLKEEGKIIMMCGDGINDSPALANSHIGLSIESGTDIAISSADVILNNNDLSKIITLIKISKKAIKNIKQNLFWAFFYNCLMIPIAIGILKPIGISINPMIASFAMILSSITVILNTLKLRKL